MHFKSNTTPFHIAQYTILISNQTLHHLHIAPYTIPAFHIKHYTIRHSTSNTTLFHIKRYTIPHCTIHHSAFHIKHYTIAHCTASRQTLHHSAFHNFKHYTIPHCTIHHYQTFPHSTSNTFHTLTLFHIAQYTILHSTSNTIPHCTIHHIPHQTLHHSTSKATLFHIAQYTILHSTFKPFCISRHTLHHSTLHIHHYTFQINTPFCIPFQIKHYTFHIPPCIPHQTLHYSTSNATLFHITIHHSTLHQTLHSQEMDSDDDLDKTIPYEGRRVRDCSDLDPKHFKSGVYTIKPAGGTGLKAYCDIETDGGGWTRHNDHAFSTKDKDNDSHSSVNCATRYKGAWWYYTCHVSNLNGLYVGNKKDNKGMRWSQWKGSQSMKTTSMMIRRKRL
ncbi:unnamed protein product [Mytilus edulis]|uniref:Fibrinogen C-terminal domain-containing protein n=1 Tax=Mytilus edulis TaxID=6550 RepID=A0A8S3S2B4_MYTED|nr:unnamed protein product [Mytilus edulis]